MKRLSLSLVLLSVFIITLGVVTAQVNKGSDIVVVDGKQYVLHKVEQGQTIYSLSREYQVEQKDLVAANPQLIFGLRQGDVLKIPVTIKQSEEQVSAQALSDVKERTANDFIYHVVKKGETVFSISRLYNVPIGSIYAYNPEAENEILENEMLRIPKSTDDVVADGKIRDDGEFIFHQVQAQETLFMLSRRYKVKVADIFDTNPGLTDHIEIGQILRIPKIEDVDFVAEETARPGEYFLHTVESGDTFFSFQRRFGVTREQLIMLNPELADGLMSGSTIRVPIKQTIRIEVKPVNKDHFYSHNVVSGETLFAISQHYGVSITDIREFNPELRHRGLVAGETLLVPKAELIAERFDPVDVEPGKPIDQVVEPVVPLFPEIQIEIEKPIWETQLEEYKVLSDDTFRISMFLPLYFKLNDSLNRHWLTEKEISELKSLKAYDANVLEKYFKIKVNNWGDPVDTVLVKTYRESSNRKLMPRSKVFVDFYQGFLLGIDSMHRAGVNIRLDLYDSELSKNVVDSILYTHDFINSNLIVGPVFPELQKAVSDFSAKNRIPMVSPFSNDDRFVYENPYYFQVNPSKDYMMKKTADFIGDEFYNKNFIVMTLGETEKLKETDLVTLIRDKFFSSGIFNKLEEIRYTKVDFTEGGHMGYWQVKRNLRADMENVIFIPATENQREREAMLSRAINSLQVLSEEFNITLIGVIDYPRFRSINTEYYHQLRLHYLTPNYIDYSSVHVNRFLQRYRGTFYAEPDQYAFRGYDIAMYFIGAYAKFGNLFVDNIKYYYPLLLQSDINFQRVDEMSGYMNHTLYIMNYTRNFNVVRKSVVTEGRLIVDK